jgi:hypothetical protein
MKKLFCYFLILTMTFEAQALELFESNVSVRAHGMGGVQIPFPLASEAVFVNPAALAFVDELSWEIFNAGFGANGIQSYQDWSDAMSTGGYSGMYGKTLFVNGNGHSSLGMPRFGLGYFNESHFDASLDSPPFPDFNINFYNDSGYQMAFGIPIAGVFGVGVAVRQVRRWGGTTSIGLSSIASTSIGSLQSAIDNKGNGYGMDLGLMAQLPGPLAPSLAFVWKDVGRTTFFKTAGTDNPPGIADNMILGAGILSDLPGLDVRTGIELRNLNDRDVQFAKKVHMGTEVSLPVVDLRAGVSQGYQSLGAGINLYLLRLDAATYTVEKGEYPGQTPDDRLEVSLSFSISLDADFGFTDSGKDGSGGSGRRRKLKQRR